MIYRQIKKKCNLKNAMNMKNILMTIIKHLQMNQIWALNNP